MRLKFNNGSIRDLPNDFFLTARLIHISQQKGRTDYKVEIDTDLPLKEQKKQVSEIQYYIDHYSRRADVGKDF